MERFPLFNTHARNKLSVTVDILRPEGMDVLRRPVKISNVFVENNATETMDKLGISYEMLTKENPDIIMLRMPAYGSTGPYKDYRALGVHIEGVIGHTLLRGYADMDPSASTPAYVADAAAGTQGAFAVLAALHYRKRTGQGQCIELSQAENAIPFLGQFFMDYSMNGRNSGTIGNRHPFAIQGCYRCKGDDRWVNITLFDDRDWEAFCTVLGRPAWTQEARFADQASRYRSHDEIDHRISQWTQEHDHYHVMQVL